MATSKADRDELLSNLSTYRLQLQQVEAALTTDPESDDLIKLKNDLEEVINLTEDLVSTQVGVTQDVVTAPRYPGRGLAAAGSREHDDDDDDDVDDDNDEMQIEAAKTWLSTDFKTGDKCRAPWTDSSGDTQYYPASIDEILEDGTCSVIFERYGTTEVTQVSLLRALGSDSAEEKKKHKTKKDQVQAQREYKRKKAQKKAQRLKTFEEEREQDKNKWLSFNSKIFSKTSKGRVKKSIFETLDESTIISKNEAKIGSASASAAGRPVTKYTHMEKWKK